MDRALGVHGPTKPGSQCEFGGGPQLQGCDPTRVNLAGDATRRDASQPVQARDGLRRVAKNRPNQFLRGPLGKLSRFRVFDRERVSNLIAGRLVALTPLLGRLRTESRDFH